MRFVKILCGSDVDDHSLVKGSEELVSKTKVSVAVDCSFAVDSVDAIVSEAVKGLFSIGFIVVVWGSRGEVISVDKPELFSTVEDASDAIAVGMEEVVEFV
jgi:hypothetical protein